MFEVGPVRRAPDMVARVLVAASGLFEVVDVEEHAFGGGRVPKISRAMHGGRETFTVSNQCVVLR